MPKTPEQAQSMLWEICNTFLIEYKKTIHGHLTSLKCRDALNNNSVHIV